MCIAVNLHATNDAIVNHKSVAPVSIEVKKSCDQALFIFLIAPILWW